MVAREIYRFRALRGAVPVGERAGGCRAEAQESGTCVGGFIHTGAGGPFPCGHDATVDVAVQFRRQPSERAPVRSAAGTDVLLPANESHAFAPRTGARGHSLAKPRQVARPACAEWWWTARLYDARQMPARRTNKGGRANAQETGR